MLRFAILGADKSIREVFGVILAVKESLETGKAVSP